MDIARDVLGIPDMPLVIAFLSLEVKCVLEVEVAGAFVHGSRQKYIFVLLIRCIVGILVNI